MARQVACDEDFQVGTRAEGRQCPAIVCTQLDQCHVLGFCGVARDAQVQWVLVHGCSRSLSLSGPAYGRAFARAVTREVDKVVDWRQTDS
ncbi:hypothetical protein D3C80_1172590 [compost metagenome]